MSLSNTLRFIYNHPLARRNRISAFSRLVRWQINTRLNPHPVLYPFAGNTKLLAWKGLTGVTGNIYTGLHEFEDMAFLLHFLREEDFFADIGANVGSYTVLAAGVCGSRAFAAEPLPDTFKILSDNITINHLSEKVILRNIGVGAEPGMLPFTSSLDTMNHVAETDDPDTINIPVLPLDETLPQVPALMKIDVEGYEMAVLQGVRKTLADQTLKALIVEINGASKRYGHEPAEAHATLLRAGFQAFAYMPFDRKLIPLTGPESQNTIYLRDIEFLQKRLESAAKVKVLGQEF